MIAFVANLDQDQAAQKHFAETLKDITRLPTANANALLSGFYFSENLKPITGYNCAKM